MQTNIEFSLFLQNNIILSSLIQSYYDGITQEFFMEIFPFDFSDDITSLHTETTSILEEINKKSHAKKH